MSILTTIRRWFNMIFNGRAKQEFNVKGITSEKMDAFVAQCARIYRGFPDWLSEDVKTINMAESICSEIARLAMLGTSITVEGSSRADWIQEQINKVYYDIRNWVEYGCAMGTVILKPNGSDIDVFLPEDFMITAKDGDVINGCVFFSQRRSNDGKKWYTRLEYHRFLDNGQYCITNKVYVGETENDLDKEIAIEDSPWKMLKDEVFISNLEKPLFSVLRMAGANSIDKDSPLRMPVFSNAIEELKDLDIAYSRNASEIFDSSRIVLMDSDRLLPINTKSNNAALTNQRQKNMRQTMELPKYVRNVEGNGTADFYQEINPNLNTVVRLEGINALLSQIGYKCGFSNGYFVMNQKTGMVTATQVESDDRRTLQMIKDTRDQVEKALEGLIYALDKFADLYDLAPVGTYEVAYDFGDLTYNREEDRARWMGYVAQGLVPAWMYFEKFEGMTEEEAKEMVEEAKAGAEKGLFDE